MLGDNGYFRKCEPYEGSAHIPFIIAGSADLDFQSGIRSDQTVCLEDVMPTLLKLAGVSLPNRADGVDLAPTLRGRQQVIRPWLHLSYMRPVTARNRLFRHLLTAITNTSGVLWMVRNNFLI